MKNLIAMFILILLVPCVIGTSAEDAADALRNLEKGSEPSEIDLAFTEFSLTHFRTDERIRKFLGDEMKVKDEWSYASARSFAAAAETSLPAVSRIEYGLTDSYGNITGKDERYFYNHLHLITGLEPGTTYHYRFVFEDEDSMLFYSDDHTITTKNIDDFHALQGSGEMLVIDEPGNYVLEKDIEAKKTAILIDSDDVLLDLGGNTITFQSEYIPDNRIGEPENSGTGVYVRSARNITIVNGMISQAPANNRPYVAETSYPGGLNPIYMISAEDVEIAGIKADYHTAQTHGFYLRYPDGSYRIHHNVIYDLGWEVINRHGDTGGRSVYLKNAKTGMNNFSIYNNLIKRTRQNGIQKAQDMHNNEIYVDSWATNSFAIGPNSAPDVIAGSVRDNKIFLTGYHAIGISWAHLDLDVSGNLILMESIDTGNRRWWEDWGDQNSLNGLRITNYGSGGQVRNNLTYSDNLIIGTLRENCEMRGTELFSDYSIKDVYLKNTVVDIRAESGTQGACIVTQGTPNKNHNPLYYINDTLVSDICNIRFGDYYGKGYNHHIINSTIIKAGNNQDYHTIIFDGAYTRDGHILQDCVFENGAGYDDVYWKKTGDLSAYSVRWTLTMHVLPGSEIEITDVDGKAEYTGVSQGNIMNIPLMMATIRPTEWNPSSTGKEVTDVYNHQKIMHTPHKISVRYNGEEKNIEIFMDSKKEIDFTGEITDTENLISSISRWKDKMMNSTELTKKISRWRMGS